jgi:hypothetical protein
VKDAGRWPIDKEHVTEETFQRATRGNANHLLYAVLAVT